MPYPFENQFVTTNPKSQHLEMPDFVIERQNVYMVPLKESVQFLFLCKPCVVHSMFPHTTQKILITDTFH